MKDMDVVVYEYYDNNANKLHKMIDNILTRLKFYNVDHEDFYSLGNEIFVKCLHKYDSERSFDGFLYSCLVKKFKTEMTRRNRKKRLADKMTVSWDTPIGNNDENSTIEDMIADKKTVESEIFKSDKGYSDNMTEYLMRLSELQRNVLYLISIGYTVSAIKNELHITDDEYNDCYSAIHAYKNVSVLLI